MKRVLCIIDSFEIGGGAQTQLAGLAVMLKQNGYHVKAMSYHQVQSRELSFEQYLAENGVEHICPITKSRKGKFTTVYNTIKNFKPHVVIAYLNGPTMICSMIKLFTSVKFKLIVSERNTTQHLSRHEWLKFQLYRVVDWVVPNSYTEEKFIKEHFSFLKEKTRAITNFVDTDRYFPIKSERDNKCFRILVVARINSQKNVLGFIEALGILKAKGIEFCVDWYGRAFYPEYEKKCRERIAQLDLEESFLFCDAIKNIWDVYNDSQYDVFCLPSFFEGCPNTLAEAMSSGLPILCSDVCDNPYYVVDGKSGYLFNPKDTESIANAIHKFSKLSSDKRNIMGSYNRELALERLSKKTFLKKYLAII